MASFIGTRKEFKRYIGPRLRNLVNILTKNHRIRVANCNHCGAKERLESAHVRGRERNQIIDVLLEGFTHNEVITIDLEIFERKFVAEHDPVEKTILILCRDCHIKYDALTDFPQANNEVGSEVQVTSVPKSAKTYSSSAGQLPIELIPPDPVVFKMELLRTRKAQIITKYDNGKEEVRVWNAPNFSPSSNVLRNLRSRPDFRQGRRQARGIAKLPWRLLNHFRAWSRRWYCRRNLMQTQQRSESMKLPRDIQSFSTFKTDKERIGKILTPHSMADRGTPAQALQTSSLIIRHSLASR